MAVDSLHLAIKGARSGDPTTLQNSGQHYFGGFLCATSSQLGTIIPNYSISTDYAANIVVSKNGTPMREGAATPITKVTIQKPGFPHRSRIQNCVSRSVPMSSTVPFISPRSPFGDYGYNMAETETIVVKLPPNKRSNSKNPPPSKFESMPREMRDMVSMFLEGKRASSDTVGAVPTPDKRSIRLYRLSKFESLPREIRDMIYEYLGFPRRGLCYCTGCQASRAWDELGAVKPHPTTPEKVAESIRVHRKVRKDSVYFEGVKDTIKLGVSICYDMFVFPFTKVLQELFNTEFPMALPFVGQQISSGRSAGLDLFSTNSAYKDTTVQKYACSHLSY